jgi:hypothetical protein
MASSLDRQSVNRTTVVGTNATLVIPNLVMFPQVKESHYYLIKDGEMRKISSGTDNAYTRMVKSFSNSILEDHPVPVEVRESKINLIFLERIRHSLALEMADRVALYPAIKEKLKSFFSNPKGKAL